MSFSNEYRVQSVLALLQAGVIVGGCLFTGTILKARGYPDQFTEIPFLLLFVRNWGFLLILIPLVWAVLTIRMEQRSEWFSRRWTAISGFALLAALVWFVLLAMARAGSSLISIAP